MRRRRMPRRTTALAALVVVAATTSCTGSSRPAGSSPAAPSRTSSTPATATNPEDLVGLWRVVAAGEPSTTSLILGDGLRVFRRCGVLDGLWAADRSGLFIAQSDGGDQPCFLGRQRNPTVTWLDTATHYQVEGADRLLLDARRHVVARLEPGAHPTVGPNRIATDASPPTLTPALRAALAAVAPLPATARAASPADVLGRWRPVGPHAGNLRAFVTFGSDGRWHGSDGCNGAGGRYAVGPSGEFLSLSGPNTLIGCDNSPVTAWASTAGRVAIEGGRLVFYDKRARLLGRCRRG